MRWILAYTKENTSHSSHLIEIEISKEIAQAVYLMLIRKAERGRSCKDTPSLATSE